MPNDDKYNMSLDERIYRALRFKNSIAGKCEDLKLYWTMSDDFNLGHDRLTVKLSEYKKKCVYIFEGKFQRQGANINQLMHAFHGRFKSLQKIGGNIYLHEQFQQLNKLTPIFLKTKELVCYRPGPNNLTVVHMS